MSDNNLTAAEKEAFSNAKTDVDLYNMMFTGMSYHATVYAINQITDTRILTEARSLFTNSGYTDLAEIATVRKMKVMRPVAKLSEKN